MATPPAYAELYDNIDTVTKEAAVNFKVPSTVNNGLRTRKDTAGAALFAGVIGAQVILSFAMIAMATPIASMQKEAEDLGCPNVGLALGIIGGNEDIGYLLGKYAGIFTGAILASFLVSAAWVYFLRAYARFCVWTAVVLKGIIVSFLGVYMLANDAATGGVICFLYTAIVWGLAYKYRAKIDTAAEVLREGVKCLTQNISILGVGAGFQVLLLSYTALNTFAILFSIRVGAFESEKDDQDPAGQLTSCTWVLAGWISGARYFQAFTVIWGILQIEVIRLYMVSFAVGCWYFPHESNPAQPALKGAKYALTTSFGTLTIGGFIMAVAEILERAARSPRTPLGCILWVVVKIFQTCINFLTKFSIVVSALTGASFAASLRIVSPLLKRNFTGGYVANRVGVNALEGGAFILSLAFGLLTGVIIDASEGETPFSRALFNRAGFEGQVGLILAIWTVGLIRYKLLGLVIMIVFPQVFVYIWGPGMTVGIFTGILTSFLFGFMAHLMLNCLDAVFVCYAIDRDNGSTSPHTATIDKVLKPSLENYVELNYVPPVVDAQPEPVYATPV